VAARTDFGRAGTELEPRLALFQGVSGCDRWPFAGVEGDSVRVRRIWLAIIGLCVMVESYLCGWMLEPISK